MRARWYDPSTGMFLSTDPLGVAGGDLNLYGYVGRDPINASDPTGTCIRARSQSSDPGLTPCEVEEAVNGLEGAAFGFASIFSSAIAPSLTTTLFWLGIAEEMASTAFFAAHETTGC
jgi:uncharacterized protein RhaS with RHS repeats